MIELPEAAPLNGAAAPGESALHVDIPIETVSPAAGAAAPGAIAARTTAAEAADEAVESLLPASRTLHPESVLTDSMLGDSLMSESMAHGGAELPANGHASDDPSMEEARGILLRAVRTEAPLAGSLTILRLRRARSRSELAGLIDEVEARIVKPYRSLAAQQTLRRARQLLFPQAYQPSSGSS